MKLVFLLLIGFRVLWSNGSNVPTRTTITAPKQTTENELLSHDSAEADSNSKKGLVNMDLTMIKINESEMYENGQTTKKDHERSYIFIKNIKSRLPWFKSRDSLFRDDFGNVKVSKGAKDNLKQFTIESNPDDIFNNVDIEAVPVSRNQSIKLNDHKNANEFFAIGKKKSNQIGDWRRFMSKEKSPLTKSASNIVARYNSTVPVKQAMKSYYLYSKVPAKSMIPKNTYIRNGFANKAVIHQEQRGQHYKLPLIAMAPPTHIPVMGLATVDEVPKMSQQSATHENVEKYINHIIRDDHVDTSEVKFDCFNRECIGKTKTYRVNLNNGIRQGANCMCIGTGTIVNSPFVPVDDRDWRMKEKPETVSEKSFIRSVIPYRTSTEPEDSYETLIKETQMLTTIVEEMEQKQMK